MRREVRLERLLISRKLMLLLSSTNLVLNSDHGWAKATMNLNDEINRLVGCYSTNEALRFDPGVAVDPACRPGDGLTISRSPTA